MKKLESDKNESFNIIKSREKESIARKVKKTNNVHGKPLRRDEKPRVSKGKCPLLFQALWERWKFFLYNDGVLPKREAFSLPHFHTNFLLFSLMFSPSSFSLIVLQHVPFIIWGILPSTKDRCQTMILPFES